MPHIHELYDFTTSAFVIHPTEAKLLLLKHLKLGKWLQPGGHVELNEDPLEALHHEMEEETGLKPNDYEILEPAEQPKATVNKNLPLPFYFNVHGFNETHKHIDITYLLKAKTSKLTDNPDGASDIGWFTLEEIKQKYDKSEMYKNTYQVCEWIFSHKL